MGFLGVAGIAIIAIYVFAQGRRARNKERAETERPAEVKSPQAKEVDPAIAAQSTGTDRE